MRAHVLNDAALLKRAGQFAWLSIDIENPVNEPFNAKFPTQGVPTFLLIDPASQKVALSWYGTATAAQFGTIMDDGVRAAAGGGSGADAALARGDQANAQKDFAKAAEAYEEALRLGGNNWPKRARTIESLVMAYSFGHKQSACAETALKEAPAMARDRSFVNTVYFGLDCVKPGTPQWKQMENLAEEAVKIPGVLSDDTSQLYSSLAYYYRQEKDETAATRIANAWVDYLQHQLAEAKSPEARIALDLQYTSAASFLHKPELVIPNLQRDERELPHDYNPPWMLARQFLQMGRLDDALAKCDRAIKLAYGVPKVRAYELRGQILAQKGDKTGARKAYEDGLAFGHTLPPNAARNAIQKLETALSKL